LVQGLEGTGSLPPPPKKNCKIWRGRRGTHYLLELNVSSQLTVGRCIWYQNDILKLVSKLHGYRCTIAYFVSLADCGCVHLPGKQLICLTATCSCCSLRIIEMLLVRRSWSLMSHLLFLSFSFSFTVAICNDIF